MRRRSILEGLAWVLALIAVAAIGWVDYITGPEIGFALFYLVPVVASAWWLGRARGLTVALTATIAWFAADFLVRSVDRVGISAWNGFTRLTIFCAMAMLVSAAHRDRQRQRVLNDLLEEQVQQVSEMARTDALTELPNVRAFREALAIELARSIRDERPIAIAYIDLDNFKRVNDSEGHAAGDEVLIRTAAIIRESTRAGDFPARIGGDEFAVLMVGTNAYSAGLPGERIVHRIRELSEHHRGCDLGASVGVVVASPSAAGAFDATSLLARADEAVYAAKARGKGRVVVDAL